MLQPHISFLALLLLLQPESFSKTAITTIKSTEQAKGSPPKNREPKRQTTASYTLPTLHFVTIDKSDVALLPLED